MHVNAATARTSSPQAVALPAHRCICSEHAAPCDNPPTCLPGGRQRGADVRCAQPAEPGNHQQHALEALHAHGPALRLLQGIRMRAWQQVWAPRHTASAACTWPTTRRPGAALPRLCAHRLARQARASGSLMWHDGYASFMQCTQKKRCPPLHSAAGSAGAQTRRASPASWR